MFSNTKIEVLSIMGQLVIASLVVIGWVLLRLYGIHDSTFDFLLVAAVTHFFSALNGSVANSKIPAATDTKIPAPVDNSTTVHVNPQTASTAPTAQPLPQNITISNTVPPTVTPGIANTTLGGKANE